jgi:hypothetical protein
METYAGLCIYLIERTTLAYLAKFGTHYFWLAVRQREVNPHEQAS